jgi:hypothetical protein
LFCRFSNNFSLSFFSSFPTSISSLRFFTLTCSSLPLFSLFPYPQQPRTDLDDANSREYLSNLRTSLLKLVSAMPGAPNSGQTLGGERPADAPVEAEAMEGMEEEGEEGDRKQQQASRQPLWDGTRDETEDAGDDGRK